MNNNTNINSKQSLDEKLDIKIKKVDNQDLRQITKIYNWYVVNSIATYQIEQVSDDYFFNQYKLNNYPFFVARIDHSSKVVGYCYTGKFRSRCGYDKSLEVSIYLDQEYINYGIGSMLMSKLTSSCLELGYKCLIAVTGSKLQQTPDSDEFYLKNGFKHSGTLPYSGYKFNQWLDTIIYSKVLI